MNTRNKVAVFGIDGGSLELIERWKDELPVLKRIMNEGVYGKMSSTNPVLTCPAWACMFTGRNPGKLGMYDFMSSKPSDNPKAVTSMDYYDSSLWKILNDYGKSVGLLNVPITYPPLEIDGYVVSGLGTPQMANVNYTYPASLKKELDKLVGGYEIIPSVSLMLEGQEDKCLKQCEKVLDKRLKTAQYLLRTKLVDLFVCVFFVSDVIQHYFWRFLGEDSKYRCAIFNIYKRLDNAIGQLIDEFGFSNVFVVSDHGFGTFNGAFSINKWLEDNEYLYYKSNSQVKESNLLKYRDAVLGCLSPKLIRLLLTRLPHWLVNKYTTVGETRDRMSWLYRNIDWEKTKAFSYGISTGNVFINTKVVKANEYEKVRRDVVEGLKKIANPKTGDPLGLAIHKKEDVYWGEYASGAPDISVGSGNGYYPIDFFGKSMWKEYSVSGAHTPQAMFMACGENIVNAKKGIKLSIYDVAPTLLYSLGIPRVKDMDGCALGDIFRMKPEMLKRIKATSKMTKQRLSEEEEEKTKKRLRVLGYLG